MLGSPLRVDLLLYHRPGWLSGCYLVCVPMNNFPHPLFKSKDHRDPQGVWGELLSSVNLGLSKCSTSTT